MSTYRVQIFAIEQNVYLLNWTSDPQISIQKHSLDSCKHLLSQKEFDIRDYSADRWLPNSATSDFFGVRQMTICWICRNNSKSKSIFEQIFSKMSALLSFETNLAESVTEKSFMVNSCIATDLLLPILLISRKWKLRGTPDTSEFSGRMSQKSIQNTNALLEHVSIIFWCNPQLYKFAWKRGKSSPFTLSVIHTAFIVVVEFFLRPFRRRLDGMENLNFRKEPQHSSYNMVRFTLSQFAICFFSSLKQKTVAGENMIELSERKNSGQPLTYRENFSKASQKLYWNDTDQNEWFSNLFYLFHIQLVSLAKWSYDSQSCSGVFRGGGQGAIAPRKNRGGRWEKANTPPFDNLFLKFF